MKLIPSLWKLGDWPEGPLGDLRPADHLGHGQDVLLDLRGEAQHAHDLGDSRPGDAIPERLCLLPAVDARDASWRVCSNE